MTKVNKQRKRILCKVKGVAEIYTIYRDGYWKSNLWRKGSYGKWDVAVSTKTNTPYFLYTTDASSEDYTLDGLCDLNIAKAIIEAQVSLAMENILKG